MQQVWRPGAVVGRARRRRRDSAERRRLRLRPARLADLPVPTHRRAQRRAAGIRIDRCAGCPTTASASSRSATSPTPGWGRVTTTAFDALAKTGGLQPRQPQPSPALTDARDEVSRLIVQWDDRARRQHRRGEPVSRSSRRIAGAPRSSALHATVGACTPGAGFDFVENALRGRWTMSCERGKLRGRDHAGADDAAEGSTARGPRAPTAPQRAERLPAVGLANWRAGECIANSPIPKFSPYFFTYRFNRFGPTSAP